MATKERILAPKGYRAVDYNEKAIAKLIQPISCTKVDGLRFHAYFDAGGVFRVVTREGIEIKSLVGHHAWKVLRNTHECSLPKDFVIDGEVWVPGKKFHETSGLLRQNAKIPDSVHVQFVVFDCVPMAALLGDEQYMKPWHDRRYDVAAVSNCAWVGEHDQPVVSEEYTFADHKWAFKEARRRGYEGLIIKDAQGLYRNGKVAGWYKMKPDIHEDGVVVGFVPGTNSNTGKLVGFVVRLESGEEARAVGFTQAFMREVSADPDKFMGRYVEVKAMEREESGKLRSPKFFALRDLDYAPGVKA